MGFLSFYVYYKPGQAGSEYFVNAMIGLLNVAFLALCGWSYGSSWLTDEEVEKSMQISPPPNTPMGSIELSVSKQQ